GYLDYLTWQNRRIVLKPTREKDGQVVVYSMRWEPANPIENLPDPMQYIKKNSKSGFQPLLFYEDRALWRDSGALLSLHRTDGHSSVEPPSTFRWLKELMYEESVKISRSAIYNVLALGMSVEPVKAKVHFDREEQIPLPLAYFTQPTLVERLVSGLQVCE